jgi:hypothetical protein
MVNFAAIMLLNLLINHQWSWSAHAMHRTVTARVLQKPRTIAKYANKLPEQPRSIGNKLAWLSWQLDEQKRNGGSGALHHAMASARETCVEQSVFMYTIVPISCGLGIWKHYEPGKYVYTYFSELPRDSTGVGENNVPRVSLFPHNLCELLPHAITQCLLVRVALRSQQTISCFDATELDICVIGSVNLHVVP